jgi:hypothetical protein
MRDYLFVSLISLVSALFLLYGISNISISIYEAQILYQEYSFVSMVARFFISLFGSNDYALRLPFLVIHIFSLWLVYKISKEYLKQKKDRLYSLAIFALLPGVNSAAIMLNSAGFVIFFTLIYIFAFHHYRRYSYLLLPLFLFVDNSFAILYIALVFFGYMHKDRALLYLSTILFALSMAIFGFDSGGKPSGHFMDSMGVYAAIFSPLVFIYFIYTMYRILIKGERNILWYISFVALAFSLVISFRQKILFEDFAPFVVLATPLMVKTFFESYRVRLSQFRRRYNLLLVVALISLGANYLLLFFNKTLYLFIQNPKDHFAYKYHIAKELSESLQNRGIIAATFEDERMQQRVLFYGITQDSHYKVTSEKLQNESQSVTISYNKKPIKTYYVTKVNNN